MKTKDIFGALLLFLLAIAFTGCNDDGEDEIHPLAFYGLSYEVPIGGSRFVGMKSGNRNYTLSVENPQMLGAAVELDWSGPAGVLALHGKTKGETTLTVTDNVTKETCELRIKVTDNYEIYRVMTPESNHPELNRAPFVFMINNAARDVYFFNLEAISLTDNKLMLKGKGTYAFAREGDDTYLSLTYATDAQGNLSDDEEITPLTHTFLLTRTQEDVLPRLNKNLNLGWPVLFQAKRDMPAPSLLFYMDMQEVGTSYKIQGYLESGLIPDGLLD